MSQDLASEPAVAAEPSPEQRAAARSVYERDGFFLAPPVLPADLLQRVREQMDAVLGGIYDTGIAPAARNYAPGMGQANLQKVDNPHLADRTIRQAISHPAIGQWAAALTGAKMVQVLATQLLFKPPSTAATEVGNVGWHQDLEYWDAHVQGQLFTAWLAISDVGPESGPMHFVRGSHRWGLLKSGDFFSANMDAVKQRIQDKHGVDSWDEVEALLPAGAVSFHDRLTVHGSGPNRSTCPRRSFAIHLRTEKSGLKEGVRYQDIAWLNDFSDQEKSPVIYGQR